MTSRVAPMHGRMLGWTLAGSLALGLAAGCAKNNSEPQPGPENPNGDTQTFRPPNTYRTYGLAAIERGDGPDAVANFETYVLLRPHDPKGRYNLGRSYLMDAKPGSAREQMFLAYEIDSDNEVYIRGYADALVATGERARLYEHLRAIATKRNTVESYLLIAEYANLLGDVDETEGALLTAAALDRGQTMEVQLKLADFYGQIGDSERQIERLRMAYFLDPGSEAIIDRATALGEIVGPSWRLRPQERPIPRPQRR